MSVPPVVMVVLAMLWLGMGTAMVVAIAILLLSPVVYSNTLRGMHLVDHGLLDLARVYRFGRWRKLRHIVLPALAIPLCSVLHVACCSGIRLVVMAEVIGAANGAGFAIANARGSLDSATVYAWVLLVVLMVAAVECLLLRPLQRHLTRWQRLGPRHAGRSEQHA
jgi:NitT/TauT family transport system permease protein